MSTFERLAELPIAIESYELEDQDREYGEFTRPSTIIHLRGDGHEGLGEDVVYDVLDHVAHRDAGPVLDLTGPATLGELCELMGELDLFPGAPPVREPSRHYRRWAYESAALDLALRQSGVPLHEAVGREPKPLTFVCSTRLGGIGEDAPPSTTEPIRKRLAKYPTLRFKLDPENDWDEDLIAELKEIADVDILDLKGLYKGTPVDVETDPDLYRRVADAFPDAYLEDPDLNDETRPVLEPHADRITWDAPLHSLADVEERRSKAINSKPSRFGSLARADVGLRLLRARGNSDLRRGPGRARTGAWADPVPRLAVSSRHPERRRAVGLQRSVGSRRAGDEPDGPGAERHRVSLGGAGEVGFRPMADQSFPDALNEQIANEFAAHQQYIGAAVYYDTETLPRLAQFFYRQAAEERTHAMMMVQYLIDVDEEVRIPDIAAQQTRFEDPVAPVRMALEQEQRVGQEINDLFKLARDAGDYKAEQFMQWFVKEQVEEVSLMTDMLNVVERAGENLLLAEDYIAREAPGEDGGDPTAPPPAGGE